MVCSFGLELQIFGVDTASGPKRNRGMRVSPRDGWAILRGCCVAFCGSQPKP